MQSTLKQNKDNLIYLLLSIKLSFYIYNIYFGFTNVMLSADFPDFKYNTGVSSSGILSNSNKALA